MLKKKHGLSFVVVAVSVLLLVACGDDDSDFATRPSEGSSSSVTPQSSDSETSVSTGTMTDSRDGLTYKTVTIGTQTWMAENLNYETVYSYCYKDSASYCSKYGRLYTWAAATTACPEGWHLPTKAEIETLFTAVGGRSTAGKVLKSTSGWNSSGNGSDVFAFSALPAGDRNYYGDYNYEGNYASFWSSTEINSNDAYYMGLYYGDDDANLGYGDKDFGFSVRCLKDDGSTTQSSSSTKISSSSVSETSVSSSSVMKTDSSEYDADNNTLTDFRDGQTYKTVTIGTQTWMAENLNYETDSSFCYNDSAKYCAKYGRLYTWAAAMDSVGTWSTNGKGCGYNKPCSPTYPVRGVCPSGWHLPKKVEFEILFTAVGAQSIAGRKLKSATGWRTPSGITNEDAFAFSALPAGHRYYDGDYYGEGSGANIWSSTEDGSKNAYVMRLDYKYDNATLNSDFRKYDGLSVRCLKD